MRLLHITPTYIPAYRYGGPIYSVHALCRSLAAAGHEVHVLTTSVDGPGDSDVPLDRPVNLDGVLVHYSRSRWLRRLYWSADLGRQCNAMAGSFDAVHLHSVFLFPTWIGARSAARAGVPYVLSPRGMLDRGLIDRRSGAVKRAWIGLIERRNLAGAAAIHLTSEEERRALADLGLALAPSVVIRNGVDVPTLYQPDAVSADVRGIIAGGFEILGFGRISWKKALDRLIRAMVYLPQARAVIAGRDEEGEATRLHAIAQACGVADRVQFLARHVGGADKEALFAAARVFVLLSFSENFGNVVVEAMIRGLPVVVTAQVGAAELVTASGGGVVTRSDPVSIGTTLSNFIDCGTQMSEMGAAGAIYAREHLDWGSIAQQFTELYRTLVEARAVKARARSPVTA